MSRQCSADWCERPHLAKGYCKGHYQAHKAGRAIGLLRTDPLSVRLLFLVDKGGDCWEWLGSRNVYGYGRTKVKGRTHMAHRAVYERDVGPIPDGLELDHKCRNRGCVNPKHLEPVTSQVNILRGTAPPAVNARKTHCISGHPFSGANLHITKGGHRRCRECARTYARAYRKKQRR